MFLIPTYSFYSKQGIDLLLVFHRSKVLYRCN